MMRIMSVSIADDLYRRLKRTAGSRGMSRFISEAVRAKLRESESELVNEYRDAENDPERRQVVKDWDVAETEGW
jgi:predicted CopG family antitoxin